MPARRERKEAPDPPQPRTRGKLVTVEEGVRLSASVLWDLQRRFFTQQDPRAWGHGRVPSYITSNAFIARATARVIGAFLDDAAAGRLGAIDKSVPIDVLELGSGSGRFAHGILRELEARANAASRSGFRARLVVTDLAKEPVEALRENPRFAKSVKRGLLDFAVFDAEAPGDIRLLESGETLPPGGPLVVLANYVFDGIRMDAFEVRGGVLHESLVRTTCPASADPNAPSSLARLRIAFEPKRAKAKVYDDAELDALLRACAAPVSEGHFLFPVSALRLLRHLRALAGRRLLVLAQDRGHAHADEFASLGPPQVMRHGSVSLDVNFLALAEHARATGGAALVPAHRPTHLATVGLLWGVDARGRTGEAFHEHLDAGGPEDLFLVGETLEDVARRIDTEHGLAWLRVAAYDPEVFLLCAPAFLKEIARAHPTVRTDLRDAARRVRAAYFPVGGDDDVHLALGETFEALDELAEASQMYEASMAVHGRSARTLHRLAACAAAQGRAAEALALLAEALAISPRNADARAMKRALEGDLRRRST